MSRLLADLNARKIPSSSGSTPSGLYLQPHDMIVEKRTIHHGMKERNPVDLMRFVGKQSLCDLDAEYGDLPLAGKKNEADYDAHIPKRFQERVIRIYARKVRGLDRRSYTLSLEGRLLRPINTNSSCSLPLPASPFSPPAAR